ncbi:MAG: hypothetical protein ACXAC7_14895 [Candidatus Hodarchaeales archaeon]|jgi:hypothetical protein
MGIDDYVGVFELWEVLMKIRTEEEKKKKPPYLSTAFIALSCIFSGLAPDKEYRLFRAMISLIKKEGQRKLEEHEIDILASILLLSAEFRRRS